MLPFFLCSSSPSLSDLPLDPGSPPPCSCPSPGKRNSTQTENKAKGDAERVREAPTQRTWGPGGQGPASSPLPGTHAMGRTSRGGGPQQVPRRPGAVSSPALRSTPSPAPRQQDLQKGAEPILIWHSASGVMNGSGFWGEGRGSMADKAGGRGGRVLT